MKCLPCLFIYEVISQLNFSHLQLQSRIRLHKELKTMTAVKDKVNESYCYLLCPGFNYTVDC